MATYLVTGVAGFIASKVAKLLLADGHTVTGIDSLNDAYDIRLKHWRLDQIKHTPNFTFHHLDICDRQGLCELFKTQTAKNAYNFDAVINLAARAGVRQSVESPWIYFETNTTGTLNLLEMCRDFEVPKFILSSTSSLYGQHNSMPYHEDADTNQPLSPYAASKKAAETLCYTYHYLYGLDVTVFRYFTVYGPAGRPDMSLFRFTQWISEGRSVTIFGDGQQSRDFTYIDDIAKGTIAGLKPLGYEVINLGSDKPAVLMEAIHLIEQLIGKTAKLDFKERHAADVNATWANISKAEQLLSWRPQVNLNQGIAELVTWYKQNQKLTQNIKTE